MGVRRRAATSHVSTYLGPRAFYTKDMEKKERAGQLGRELPPRCVHCRQSFHVVMLDGAPHCPNHALMCDCKEEDDGTVQ
jgi:hypothetical protein